MAAELAPAAEVAWAIGTVQTAQRLGPAVGPVIGGILAGLVGLRRAFLVTAGVFAVGLLVVMTLYDERATHPPAGIPAGRDPGPLPGGPPFPEFLLFILSCFAVPFL